MTWTNWVSFKMENNTRINRGSSQSLDSVVVLKELKSKLVFMVEKMKEGEERGRLGEREGGG